LRRAVQVIKFSKPANEDAGTNQDNKYIKGSPANDGNVTEAAADVAASDSSAENSGNIEIKKVVSGTAFKPHQPVLISGYIVRRGYSPENKVDDTQKIVQPNAGPGRGKPKNTKRKTDPFVGAIELITHLEIHAESMIPLNEMPRLPLANIDTNLGPERRHLQFRIDDQLRTAIRKRSKVMAESRKFLFMKGFDEIETPLLFKSTPEGAREFIVPTRTKGMAYALPQSPQQYKQMLMASGFSRYFQFARCFRDEDMRADRQPEFTQVSLSIMLTS